MFLTLASPWSVCTFVAGPRFPKLDKVPWKGPRKQSLHPRSVARRLQNFCLLSTLQTCRSLCYPFANKPWLATLQYCRVSYLKTGFDFPTQVSRSTDSGPDLNCPSSEYGPNNHKSLPRLDFPVQREAFVNRTEYWTVRGTCRTLWFKGLSSEGFSRFSATQCDLGSVQFRTRNRIRWIESSHWPEIHCLSTFEALTKPNQWNSGSLHMSHCQDPKCTGRTKPLSGGFHSSHLVREISDFWGFALIRSCRQLVTVCLFRGL